MIENILYSLQKYFKERGIDIAIDNSDGKMQDDFITLSSISPEEFVISDNIKKSTYSILIYLYGVDKREFWKKIDKYLSVKSASEQPFTVYDFSSGNAITDFDCSISMPEEIVFKAPFGQSAVDTIYLTIRR